MCFYNDDYEWSASVHEETEGPAEKATRCYECGEPIAAGQWRRHIYQQEDEECRLCEQEEGFDPECQHDYGETFDYDRCEPCDKVLRAIEAVEKDEGCPEYSRQPMLGELRDVFVHPEDGNAMAYAERAVAMFPEVATVGWFEGVLDELTDPEE